MNPLQLLLSLGGVGVLIAVWYAIDYFMKHKDDPKPPTKKR